MSSDGPFDRETVTRSVASGVEAILHREDGTALKAWGATEDDALNNLGEAMTDVE